MLQIQIKPPMDTIVGAIYPANNNSWSVFQAENYKNCIYTVTNLVYESDYIE